MLYMILISVGITYNAACCNGLMNSVDNLRPGGLTHEIVVAVRALLRCQAWTGKPVCGNATDYV